MAQTLENLSRQNETLTSIRGIVGTMKTLSAINAAPYEKAALSIKAYHQTILQGFAAFAHRAGDIALHAEDAAEHWVVVFGSDHGLCGNYNEVLAKVVHQHCQAHAHAQAQAQGKPHLLVIGAKLHGALVDQGLAPEVLLLPPASAEGIGRLAGEIVTRLDAMGQGQALHRLAVTLAFTQRGEEGDREPVTRQLLPLEPGLLQPGKRWHSRSLPDYHMATGALLAALVRNHIFASVFRASAEAMVTENAARLALMQQAEKSVDERRESVRGELRSVRQTEITDELMDVIMGFEALKKRRLQK